MTSCGSNFYNFHENQLIKLLLKNLTQLCLQLPFMVSNKTGGLISTNIIWSHVIVRGK